ncbi:helix-turn-helix domain-containing protein [Sporomusa sphaeroides]|uniref:helix-turn-helix domain-containing protein n=1 Tax=Sporomusa sphaeroides TaxID=47679 RepID=UPI002B6C992B|nr:helix-turn-helix transcriptional regulator [Sporomusa sphaeroides]HML33801.1 helix-turn-helix transcriptional regulator [Sporomusa sphaeroides]
MLGEHLKQLRENKKLTQQEMADKIGIARGTYAHYEINRREPDNATLARLADFFGVTTDELLGRKLQKGQVISVHHPNPEVAQLLKDGGIAKLKLAKDVTLDELKTGIELVKTLRKQKTGD